MRTIRLPEIDDQGNFLDPQILERLREQIGGTGDGPAVSPDPDVAGAYIIN